MSAKRGVLSSLRHHDFRRLMIAFTTTSAGCWAYNVALTVWIFDETGSVGWVGAATVGRFVPALLFSAYGGVIAERFERVRLMVILNVLSALVMVALALEMAVHAPVVLAIVTTAITSTLGTIYDPAVAAITPQLVGERDLGAANALRNSIDNIAVIAGPGLGVLFLLLGPPWVAIGVNAACFVVSALTVGRIKARSVPVDVTERGKSGAFAQMLVGVRTIATSQSAAVLVAYSLVATFVFGVDTVQFVVLSSDPLGTGADGYGYLLAGLGVGGILAAGLVSRLDALPRLGPVILGGMAAYCLPTLLFLVVSSPEAAFVIQIVRGAGTVIVDVLAVTALQRSLPRDVLARVFGAFQGLMLAAILAGALLAPMVITGWGLDASLWLAGAGVPIACLAGWPALRGMDYRAAIRRAALAPRMDALAACVLFESVSDGSLAQLAGAATDIDAVDGTVVVGEGDDADAFYIILSGELFVTARGERPEIVSHGTLGTGDYFGEIGLIERIPRTATVTATAPTRLLRIDGAVFLGALTEFAPSAALLDGASLRLGQTHPSLRLTRAGLSAADGRS